MEIMQKNSKIYVAGHRGLVGSALMKCLQEKNFNNILSRTHKELDLIDQKAVRTFFEKEKPEYVFLAAAKVGGILANNTYPAEFIYQNLAIQNNVIHYAWKNGVKRLLFLGSSCIYPRECPQPIKEEYLLTGPLESTNRPYAVAKIAGIEMCWSYNRQYSTQYLAVMPTNLYGPGDNYDLQNSHVLPAIIRKFHLAKLAQNGDLEGIQKDEKKIGPIPPDIKKALGLAPDSTSLDTATTPQPVFWGTGVARREFLYSTDMADACVYLMSLPEDEFYSLLSIHCPPLVNIGCGMDQPISTCVDLVKNIVGYCGDVQWDHDKPDGTPQKLLDTGLLTGMGWHPKIGMTEGIEKAYADYLNRIEK
jgi:GDP-L-fucose synthase